MVCIHCGDKTHVINSRLQKRNNQVWRRRQCLACKAIFTTEEAPDYTAAWMVNTGKGLRPFSRDKLFLSLYASCKHRKTALRDAAGLTDSIIAKAATELGSGIVSSSRLASIATVALNRFDTAASSHYQAYHQLD